MNAVQCPAPPYAADVRAKGWQFQLDYERIEQSDTWALAPAELRPWLLMLWLTAWKQTPCGSLPADDALIAARIGMPAKTFQKHRAVLRRGWWQAEDGRLYHDTIVSFVVDMMTRRRSEADRKARGRAKGTAVVLGGPSNVPRDNGGTTGGVRPESDTGTGTGTGTGNTKTTHHPRSTREGGGESAKPTKAGEVCRAIKAKGIADVNPSHPVLLEYIAKGVAVEVFEAAAETCAKAKPPKGMAYLLGIVKRQLGEAAEIAAVPGLAVGAWDANRTSIEAKAKELGMDPWNEHDLSANREMFPAYTERVRARLAAAGVHA